MGIKVLSAGDKKIPSFDIGPFVSDTSLRNLAQVSVTRSDGRSAWPLAGAVHELLTAVDIANQKLGVNKVAALVHADMVQRIASPSPTVPFGLSWTNGIMVQAGDKIINFHYVYGGIEDWFTGYIANQNKSENKLHYDCGFADHGMPEKLADIFVRLARNEPLLPPAPPERTSAWQHMQGIVKRMMPRSKTAGP